MNARDPINERHDERPRPTNDEFMRLFVSGPGAAALRKAARDHGQPVADALYDAFIIFGKTTAAANPLNFTLTCLRNGFEWAAARSAARRAREAALDDAAGRSLLDVLPAVTQADDDNNIDDELYLRRHTPAGKRKITNFLKDLSPAQKKYAVLALAGLNEEQIAARLGKSSKQVANMLSALCGERPLPPAPRRRKLAPPPFLAAQQVDLLEAGEDS
jgi:DNA-directed RNA polymerase specialized sigma24 family protein